MKRAGWNRSRIRLDRKCYPSARNEVLPLYSERTYEISVTFEGFEPTTVRVTVGTRPPSPLHITLPLAGLTQEVTVSTAAAEVDTAATTNSDAVSVDQAML